MRLNEAYLRVVNEDAEGKNINRAEKYVKQNHPEIIGRRLQNGVEMTPRVFTQEVRNLMPNVRGANCKFLLGASRIYFDDLAENPGEMQRKASSLNKILKLVTSDAHVNEYDNDLNGLGLKELEERFGGAVSKNLKDDMSAISSKQRAKNEDYEIVKIPDFESASKYGQYTSWCVTHDEYMFDNYTNGGTGLFYFCLRSDYQTVPKNTGEGCPLDDYGKSMIAVSVNDDGSLNTCTCRWNHDNGGNDGIMTTEQISDLLGVDFYKTFKPRDVEDIWKAYKNQSVDDDFADKMGWLKVKGDDGYHVDYVSIDRETTPPRIVRRRRVFLGRTDRCAYALCVAIDHFYWYDADTGKPIGAPYIAYGFMNCLEWSQLTSLEGSPRKVTGSLDVTGCRNLKDIKQLPKDVDGFSFRNCNLSDDSIDYIVSQIDILTTVLGVKRDAITVGKGGAAVSTEIYFDYLLQKLSSGAYGRCFGDLVMAVQYSSNLPMYIIQRIFTSLAKFVDPEPFDSVMRNRGIEGFGLRDVIERKGRVERCAMCLKALDDYERNDWSLRELFWRAFGPTIIETVRKVLWERVFPKLFIDKEFGVKAAVGDFKLAKVTIPPDGLKEVVSTALACGDGSIITDIVIANAMRHYPHVFVIPEEVKDVVSKKSELTEKWDRELKMFAEYVADRIQSEEKENR